jgi:hypothetical protein
MTTYFFDNCLSIKYARMLQALDVAVIHLQEQFAANTPDEIWLPHLRDSGYVVVTSDRAIRKGSATALALKESGVTAIFLPKGFEEMRRWDQAVWLIRHWPNVEAYIAKAKTGALVQMTNGGSFTPIVLK